MKSHVPRSGGNRADRALSSENVGVFDFVWSAGLLYHLDDLTDLFLSIGAITDERSYVCIEGHIASQNEQACLPSPNPPIIAKTLDGETYHGNIYKEFDETTTTAEKELQPKASLDNPCRFGSRTSRSKRCSGGYGFEDLMALRSEWPTVPLGPDLVYAPVDPKREWSRCMFLASRSAL